MWAPQGWALRMSSPDVVRPRLVNPRFLWVPGGWPQRVGSRLVAPVGWAPRYKGEVPTEMAPGNGLQEGGALGVVPKGWAPGGGP